MYSPLSFFLSNLEHQQRRKGDHGRREEEERMFTTFGRPGQIMSKLVLFIIYPKREG
jgi:hypothetical protein